MSNLAELLADALKAGMLPDLMLDFADAGPRAVPVLEVLLASPALIVELNEAHVTIKQIIEETEERLSRGQS